MLKTYTQDFTLKTLQCDFTSQWRPSAVLEAMQETATTHSELLGVGRNMLLSNGMVWIVTRLEVEIDKYPKLGDTVSIETFPMPVRRWLFPRYFIIRDGKGDEIGRAGSLWALMDISTRRMAHSDQVLSLMPDNSDLLAPLGLPAPVTEISGICQSFDITPCYTDLDQNFHVNNTRYMDWCCNSLGIDTMKNKCIKHFVVNYDAEIAPTQQIRAELRQFGDAFCFTGSEGQTRHFDIGGTLSSRE